MVIHTDPMDLGCSSKTEQQQLIREFSNEITNSAKVRIHYGMFYEPLGNDDPKDKDFNNINPLTDINEFPSGEILEQRSYAGVESKHSKSRKNITVSSIEEVVRQPKRFRISNHDILKNGHKRSNNTMKLFKHNCEAINDFRKVRQRYLVDSPFIKEDLQAIS